MERSPIGHEMCQAYEAIQVRWRGAIFVHASEPYKALLRKDPVPEDRQVSLLLASSAPIVLPTEFLAHSAGGERDAGFAQNREMLRETLKVYQRFETANPTEFIFKHRVEPPSRTRLAPIEPGVRLLDQVIQNRKVGLLGVMGKPREGKSAFLGIALRPEAFAHPAQPLLLLQFGRSALRRGAVDWFEELTQRMVERERRTDPDKRDQRDKDSAALPVDSEGLFANDENGREYSVRLFTIAAVVSSCLIFNNEISNTAGKDFLAPLASLAALFRDFYDRNSWITERAPGVVYRNATRIARSLVLEGSLGLHCSQGGDTAGHPLHRGRLCLPLRADSALCHPPSRRHSLRPP